MKKRILSLLIVIFLAIPGSCIAGAENTAEFPGLHHIVFEDFGTTGDSNWTLGVQQESQIKKGNYTSYSYVEGDYEIVAYGENKAMRMRRTGSNNAYPLWRIHYAPSNFQDYETIVVEYKIKPVMGRNVVFRSRAGGTYGTYMPALRNGKIYENQTCEDGTDIGTYTDGEWITLTNILYIDSYNVSGAEGDVKTLKRDVYSNGKYLSTIEEKYSSGAQDFADGAGNLYFSFNLVYASQTQVGDEKDYVDIDYFRVYTEAPEFAVKSIGEISDTNERMTVEVSNHPTVNSFGISAFVADAEGNPVCDISSAALVNEETKTDTLKYVLNFSSKLESSTAYKLIMPDVSDTAGRHFSGEIPFVTPPERKYAQNLILTNGDAPAEALADGEYVVTGSFINDGSEAQPYTVYAALYDGEGILSSLQAIPLSGTEKDETPIYSPITLSDTEGKTLKLFAALSDGKPASAVSMYNSEDSVTDEEFKWCQVPSEEEVTLKNEINGDTQVITAKSGETVKGRPVMLFVLKEGKTVADINPASPMDTVVQVVSGNYASEGFSYKIPDVKGIYEAYFCPLLSEKNGEETFEFFGAEYIAGGLEIIKDIEADEVEAFLEDYAKAFTIDLTAYNEYTPEEKERFGKSVEASRKELEGKAFEGFTDFSKAIEDAETLISIKTNADVKETMEALAGETGKLLYKEVISENAKTETEKAVLKEEPLTLKEYASFFDEAAVLCGIEKSENYSQTDEIIKKSTEVTGIDLTSYNNLKKPKNVTVALSNKSFASPEALKDAFDDAVADQKRAEALGGSSGGSGGGGGNGGSAAIKSQVGKTEMDAVVPEKKEIIQSQKKFTDLEGFSWAEEAIHSLREKGIVNGKTEDTFAPEDNITRAEFAKMTVEAFGLKRIGLGYEFKDVSATDWFYGAVLTAYENGAINGTGNDKFAPFENITRQDAAVILYRASEKKLALSGEKEFKDSGEVSDYAKNAVSVFGANGIINGFSDGSFAPKMSITRAQAAVIINNILNK